MSASKLLGCAAAVIYASTMIAWPEWWWQVKHQWMVAGGTPTAYSLWTYRGGGVLLVIIVAAIAVEQWRRPGDRV